LRASQPSRGPTSLHSTNPIGRFNVIGNTGDPWGSLSSDWSGPIGPHAAENLSAVVASVQAIAGGIAALPAFVTKADDSRASVDDHPLSRLIEYGPNDAMSWSDFVEALLASALLRGNALSSIKSDDRGRLQALHFVPWDQVRPLLTDQNTLAFEWTPVNGPQAGKTQRLGRQDTLFLKDRGDGPWLGESRLTRARGALQIALELQNFSGQFLSHASRPGGTLKGTTNLGDEQKKKLKAEWDIAFNGRERGKVAVLPSGMEYEPLAMMSNEDSQLLGLRAFSVQDVSRIFNVPLFMLGDSGRATYASARESSRQFATQALVPWVKKLERAFAQSVLSTQYRLVIDLGDLLRADPEARWASWQRARQAGVLSPNDVRREEGWPASSDPTADSIEPPISGGKPADATADEPPAPAPPPADDGGDKIARLGDRRSRHGND
jgi:HK97 family phage portal protein